MFADELWLFAASAVLFGVGIGASVTLSNLSIIKYMGIDLLAQTFGFEGLVNSLCVLVIGPLLGKGGGGCSTNKVVYEVKRKSSHSENRQSKCISI